MSVYQHFRKHEHPFVDQVLSWKEHVEKTFSVYVTDFLDPREQEIITSLIGTSNEEIQFSFFGGAMNAERKRAVIAPFYEEVNEEYFQVALLEAIFPAQFVKIEHRDILGAFMSLGIDRKKIGDILVANDRFQIVTTVELSSYLKMNLTKINQANIKLIEKPFTELLISNDEWITKNQTVSSLRLDVIIKEVYQMSRKDAHHYIKGNRVKVNFTEIEDPALQVMIGDLISVRGHGRSKVTAINGTTRKEKIRITTARLKT